MKKPSIKRIASVALLAFFGFGSVANAELAVIVNSSNAVTTLTEDDISRIFLGKTKTFPDGSSVIPLDQVEGSSVRDKFYADIIKKTGSQLKSYWSRIIFTGKGQPPQQMLDDVAVKELVSKNPNVVGYVDSKAVDGSVKKVFSVP
jgi:ABC-type phosphate transport system substrate-binding protein